MGDQEVPHRSDCRADSGSDQERTARDSATAVPRFVTGSASPLVVFGLNIVGFTIAEEDVSNKLAEVV
jgi:hypothetical protein